ncbi:hypothetical protein [Streptomyces sp. ISL-11]|uniref:hypothetical protein n=1 Tax=Streptomyces sp. ISL-11 TaxID=2819174 RepID=UPI001BEB3E0A|nr:hypothetical protein [Streptomyces sp. ISL-11]MBT2387695.1 hypothetical protein [Streptomyces sp. ISL-11]
MVHLIASPPELKPRREKDPSWWAAPLTASLLAVPPLAGEYALYHRDGYGQNVLLVSLLLLVCAWALPHHRSLRALRVIVAVAAVGLSLLPIGFAVLLGLAMASGAA